MRLTFIFLLTLGLAFTGLAPNAAAQSTRVTLSGSTTTTSISGSPGNASFRVSFNEPNAFLTSFAFRERSDDPCDIRPWGIYRVTSGRGAGNYDSATATLSGIDCGSSGRRGTRRSEETIVAPNPPGPGLAAIHGIRVCTNGQGRRTKLKGATALVSLLNRDQQGQIRREGGLQQTFKRRPCRPSNADWRQVRRCPTGQIAVGVQVYYDDARGRNGFDRITGIALRCRSAQVTNVPG